MMTVCRFLLIASQCNGSVILIPFLSFQERCVDNCAGKLIRSNHRLMSTYVQLMPRMVQRRMEEMESKAAENAKAAEALASSSAQASPVSQSQISSLSPLQESPLLTPSVTDDAPEARGSLVKPTALDILNNNPVSQSGTSSEVKLSAAEPLTPATEQGYLNNAGQEPSYLASFPQSPVGNAPITLESSPPVMESPKPSPSIDAPTVSKSTEIPLPSHQQ